MTFFPYIAETKDHGDTHTEGQFRQTCCSLWGVVRRRLPLPIQRQTPNSSSLSHSLVPRGVLTCFPQELREPSEGDKISGNLWVSASILSKSQLLSLFGKKGGDALEMPSLLCIHF